MGIARAALVGTLLVAVAACTADPRQVPVLAGSSSGALGVRPGVAAKSALYVADQGAVTVYDLAGGGLLRTIANANPRVIAINGSGNLFVANDKANAVTVYARGSDSVLRTIREGLRDPKALAFDASRNLYVANNIANTVTVYAPGSDTVLRTITDGLNGPQVLLFNRPGDLFVGSDGANHITVYPSGGTRAIRTIVTHNGPLALAFSHRGYLYCVNNFNVTVYKPGATQPYRTISQGISIPSTLAFDNADNLYVANWGINMLRSSISVFPPGASAPNRIITDGIGFPLSLRFDSSGNLYVANSGWNTVTEYASGSSTVERTISKDVAEPSALQLGP